MNDLYRLLRYAKPYIPALLASVVFMAVVGLSQGLLVKLIPLIFDRVLKPNAPDVPEVLYAIPAFHWRIYLQDIFPRSIHNIWSMVAFGILACFIAKGICDYCGNYLVNWVGISAVTNLRQQVFDQILRHDAQFFETHQTGRVMSSIMNDIEKIQVSISSMLADWLRQIFTAAFLLLAMISIDWRLSLVTLLVFPVVALLTVRLGKRIRATTRDAQDRAADLNQILQETISGHQVVKSFGAEDFESNRFLKASQRLKAGSLTYVAQQALASPIIELLGASTIVLLLSYARDQVKVGHLTSSSFTGFILALLFLYEPIKRLTGIHNIFQQGVGASMKVFEYLDRQEGVMDRPNAIRPPRFQRAITFEDVVFCYPRALNRTVLNGINLEVKAGQVVALVGASGAGKSTLANLVPRFYDITAGTVRIDGRDVRDIRLSALREQISTVPQDTFLFNDTVFNNIAYGRPDAKAEDVLAAAKAAFADDFVQQLPEKYDSFIGERGMQLSGGQRQRIAIARALLKNAPILILDEATSHLDSESEQVVQKALGVLMEGRTVIVIAHRLSTIRRADQIIVIENGRIAETGTHDQLMLTQGPYHRLHEMQMMAAS